jgi:hypothetical protein
MHWFYLKFETLLLITRLLVTLPLVTWNGRKGMKMLQNRK